MTVKTARDLAIKVFGVYYLAAFIVSIPGLLGTVFTDFSSVAGDSLVGEIALKLLSVASILLNFAVGGVLVFRTDRVVRFVWRDDVSDDSELPNLGGPLSFWITLIGFFYLVSSLEAIAGRLFLLVSKAEGLQEGLWMRWSFPSFICFFISLAVVLKARKIAGFILRQQEISVADSAGTEE
jgi:hypothetical protein